MRKEKITPKDFSQGKMSTNIIVQAIPLTIAQFVQLLYNVVDRIYIGHLPDVGSLALTGVGVTFPIVTLILAFASLLSTGGTPLFSIARGEQNDERAKRILNNVFILALIFSMILFAVCFAFRVQLLYLFGASENTIYYAEGYLKIYLFGIIFSMLSTGLNGFISALGFPRKAMFATIIGTVLNLILDPIFIFALSMGVNGAALATVISQFVSALLVISFLAIPNVDIKIDIKYMKLDLKIVSKIISLGISGFMQQATNCIVQIICNVTLQTYGGDVYVGIMTIINSVREIATLPVTGISSGAQPVLGYNYGANKPERVKSGIKFMSTAGIIYTVLIWSLIEAFPSFFFRIFSSDISTINSGIIPMRLYFMGFVFMSLQFMGQSTFVGLGKSKYAVFFSILRKIIIVVPLTVFLPKLFNLQTNGVFIAEPISNLLGGLACFVTMYTTVYKKL